MCQMLQTTASFATRAWRRRRRSWVCQRCPSVLLQACPSRNTVARIVVLVRSLFRSCLISQQCPCTTRAPLFRQEECHAALRNRHCLCLSAFLVPGCPC